MDYPNRRHFWVIYKMSGFSANRIAFGGKTRHSHSTQLLVDESINATVRLGGGVGRGDICGLFPKCRLFPRTKFYVAEEPDILKLLRLLLRLF